MNYQLMNYLVNKRGKLTQTEVAHGAGISTSLYSKLETGERNITLEVAFKLAIFYKVHPYEIVIYIPKYRTLLNQLEKIDV